MRSDRLPTPKPPRAPERSRSSERTLPKPPRDCCQSGCYGCAWADAMRELGEL